MSNTIDSYSFGKIKINNKLYSSDVIIFPNKVMDNWWRKKGHRLHIEDLSDVFEYKPEVLVIGKGAYGFMKIPDETKQYIKDQGIELKSSRTKKATKTYNSLKDQKKTVAALHLTC